MFMYYTVCYFTDIFYVVVRQIYMLFIDNKDSVFFIKYLQLNLPLAEASRKAQRETERERVYFPFILPAAINGYIYGNNPAMEMPLYSTVDWHLMSLGNEVDIHSVHFHGNDVIMFQNGRHIRDVTQLFPGIFETVRMNATMAGQWLLHCHVHDHLVAGMETTYIVQEQKVSTSSAEADDVDPWGDSHARIN